MLLILALIFLSVTVLSITFSYSLRQEDLIREEELRNRLRKSKHVPVQTQETKTTKPSLLKTFSSSGLLKKFVPENFSDRLSSLLAEADIELTVNDFLILSGISMIVLTILGLIIGKDPSVGFLFFIMGILAPYFYLKKAITKKANKFDSLLSDAITMVANTLKSGFGFQQALQVVSEEMPAPMSTEFKKVIQEITWGLTIDEALANLNKRMKNEDLDLVITSVLIQSEIGGNLSEILNKISETIRERKRIKGEISSLTAQGKVSGVIVGSLPIAIGGMILTINPKYMLSLFTNVFGLIALSVAIFLEVIGALIIKKIIALDV